MFITIRRRCAPADSTRPKTVAAPDAAKRIYCGRPLFKMHLRLEGMCVVAAVQQKCRDRVGNRMADQSVGSGGSNAYRWPQLMGNQAFDGWRAADVARADGQH